MPEVTPPLKSALEGVTTLKLLVYSNYPKSIRKFSAYVRLATFQSDVSIIHENPSNTKSSGVEIPMMCCWMVEHFLFSWHSKRQWEEWRVFNQKFEKCTMVRLFHLKMVQKAFISFSIFEVGGNVSRFDCFAPSFWSFFSHLFAWIDHGRHHSNRGRSPGFQFRDEHRVRKTMYSMGWFSD